jgi:hypothetical protein
VLQAVAEYTHQDGYVYPPQQTQVSVGPKGEELPVPNSERPALLHRLPATHTISLDGDMPQGAARYGLAGFVVHLLGFLCGFRCQFFDWWFEGRLPTKSLMDHHDPSARELSAIVSTAVPVWAVLPDRQRLVAINVLYLHSRAATIELEWERFLNQYLAFDGAFSLARGLGHVGSKVRHNEKISALAGQYGLCRNQELEAKIVALRNDLIHEALWDGRMPGDARSQESYYAYHWLTGITKRAILAALGCQGEYTVSSWFDMLTHFLNVTPRTSAA